MPAPPEAPRRAPSTGRRRSCGIGARGQALQQRLQLGEAPVGVGQRGAARGQLCMQAVLGLRPARMFCNAFYMCVVYESRGSLFFHCTHAAQAPRCCTRCSALPRPLTVQQTCTAPPLREPAVCSVLGAVCSHVWVGCIARRHASCWVSSSLLSPRCVASFSAATSLCHEPAARGRGPAPAHGAPRPAAAPPAQPTGTPPARAARRRALLRAPQPSVGPWALPRMAPANASPL